MNTFMEGMANLNKTELAEKVRLDGMNVVFLQVESVPGEWSRWIILPNQKMILWQIEGNQALKWNMSDFNTVDKHGLVNVGALVSEHGEIIPESNQ